MNIGLTLLQSITLEHPLFISPLVMSVRASEAVNTKQVGKKI